MVNVKLLGISTSPRHANTEMAVKWALESAAELPGVETEFISLVGKRIDPCKNCRGRNGRPCEYAEPDNPCPGIQRDAFRELCLKMLEPDAFIMGAMVDYQTAGALFHCLKSRLMSLDMNRSRPKPLRNKVFGAVAIGGTDYGGMDTTLQYMVMWAIQADMHVVGCGPEHGRIGGGFLGASGATCNIPGGALMRGRGPLVPGTPAEMRAIEEDKTCFLQCKALGKRVAETAKIIKGGFEVVPRKELHWPKGPSGGYDFKQKPELAIQPKGAKGSRG